MEQLSTASDRIKPTCRMFLLYCTHSFAYTCGTTDLAVPLMASIGISGCGGSRGGSAGRIASGSAGLGATAAFFEDRKG